MTTATYRDELDGLSDAITAYKQAANYGERALESGRLYRWWDRLAKNSQPKRLPSADKVRCEKLMRQAAELLNGWVVEEAAGPPEHDERPQPSAKAMADTMRFCSIAKRRGFA